MSSSQFDFLRPYLRGWFIIAGAMIMGYLLAAKYLNYTTPTYESTAKIKLADHNEGIANSNLFKDFDVFANTQKIQAEIELIKSHTIIKKALEKIPFETVLTRKGNLKNTDLFNDAPLMVSKLQIEEKFLDKPFLLEIKDTNRLIITNPQGITQEANTNDTIKTDNSIFVVDLNKELLRKRPDLHINDQYWVVFLSEEKLIAEIQKNLDVSSVDKDVPVIRISYKSSNPEKAALFSNVLAQTYIEDYIQTKYSAANITSQFLDARIHEISSKLVGSEAAILDYRKQENITNIQQETETDLRKIAQMKVQQTNLKMSLDAIKELETYMEKGQDNFLDLAPNFEAFTDLLSTELIKKIKELQAEKKDLLLEYTPKHEKVIIIDQKIKDISSYFHESIKNTRKNLQSKYDNLVYDIEEAEKVFVRVPEKEKVMTQLNREFEIFQQSYNFLNQKKIEADIAKAAKVAFHRIITPAEISTVPISPNRIIIKGVSVILGLLGGTMLIFLIHSLRAKVNDVSSIESRSMIPLIAAVPKLKSPAEKENFFLTTLTQWQVKKILPPQGIINFTGYHPSEGATFITQQTIQSLIRQGRKILTVEFGENTATADYYTLNILNEQHTSMVIDATKMSFKTTEAIQENIQQQSKNFDRTIISNSNFGAPYTLALMAIAQLNVVCIDTRLTSAKRINEVDLLKEEYALPAVHFALNRVGYHPSFLKETVQSVIGLFHCIKKNTTQK